MINTTYWLGGQPGVLLTNKNMSMNGPVYIHASIATPGLAANHDTGNGLDHLCIVGHPIVHIIFPSSCSNQYSLWCIIQRMNYTQVQDTTELQHGAVNRIRHGAANTLLFDKNIEDAFYHTLNNLLLSEKTELELNRQKFQFSQDVVEFVGPPNNIFRSDPLWKSTDCYILLPDHKKYHRCKILVWAGQLSC